MRESEALLALKRRRLCGQLVRANAVDDAISSPSIWNASLFVLHACIWTRHPNDQKTRIQMSNRRTSESTPASPRLGSCLTAR
ncbi:hypothetical protein BDV96DRAFT_582811 [Lophiotrema nucula]|uniref:Uncharacterized protein n=1 Tax=Lophiotrema nucula TaxID=690887 RepID=A0A6A5YYU5_9PLEO|nr:hypothetical protein BDV96DRAFT_582811 [Lophiotrema nucula]